MAVIAATPVDPLSLLLLGALLCGAFLLLGWLFVPRPEDKGVLRDNPALNTRDWTLHQERLQRFRNSKYRGLHYFYGPRGGLYYINRNGHKTYC